MAASEEQHATSFSQPAPAQLTAVKPRPRQERRKCQVATSEPVVRRCWSRRGATDCFICLLGGAHEDSRGVAGAIWARVF
jgi:hypothetical protein